jgi:hypothetical protein
VQFAGGAAIVEPALEENLFPHVAMDFVDVDPHPTPENAGLYA